MNYQNYQLSRRSFIYATAATALTQLLSGCSNFQATSKILFLENSIPPQLIGDFRKAISKQNHVYFEPQAQLEQIFDLLFTWQKSEKTVPKDKKLLNKILNKSVINPNLTTLGDVWLTSAIKQNLIQPLSVKDLANWQKLPSAWRKLVQRNEHGDIAQDGKVWGAPYRTGSTVIAYQSKKLAELGLNITDWKDLWQSELRDRISLLDSPRETIGLTLKKLGYSYNTDNLSSLPNLEPELLTLHNQAKFYSSDHYLEPLALGDTWAAVAWSTDIIPMLQRYPDIKFVIPQSGTSLWVDLWVRPKTSTTVNKEVKNDDLNQDVADNTVKVIAEWINFCWQPKAAKQISLFTDGISPILLSMKPEEYPPDLQNNPFLSSAVLQSKQSEFLLPLSSATEKQYQDLWLKIRQSKAK